MINGRKWRRLIVKNKSWFMKRRLSQLSFSVISNQDSYLWLLWYCHLYKFEEILCFVHFRDMKTALCKHNIGLRNDFLSLSTRLWCVVCVWWFCFVEAGERGGWGVKSPFPWVVACYRSLTSTHFGQNLLFLSSTIFLFFLFLTCFGNRSISLYLYIFLCAVFQAWVRKWWKWISRSCKKKNRKEIILPYILITVLSLFCNFICP